MQRGEIWWAEFGRPRGSEPGYRRPALVVQADAFNRSRIGTIVVVPLTSNLQLAAAPGNVLCRRRDTGLSKQSVANVSQVSTIDRRRLTERLATVPAAVMAQVDDGLRLVLAL